MPRALLLYCERNHRETSGPGMMSEANLFQEIMATYAKYGWTLREVLLRADTGSNLGVRRESLFGAVPVKDFALDALWFARASHGGREAWELRLVTENPYALFETFEPDEPEDLRVDARREMEANLVERVGAGLSPVELNDE